MKIFFVLFAVVASNVAVGQTLYRIPLPLADDQCGNGRCWVSAYFDTSRSEDWYSDWGCGTRTYNQHDGVDFAIDGFKAMDEGRWVLAAAGGWVAELHDGEFDRCTTANCGVGNYVILLHPDGKYTWYWHLKAWTQQWALGEWVPCGAQIGQVGSSGNSYGPHLHFGVQLPSALMDDPFGATNPQCGTTGTYWTDQGPYGGMPGQQCQ